jgi:hypothetical protein
VFKATRSSAAVASLLAILSACRSPRPRIVPLPAEVVAVEGYGTVKLVRGGESGRSRFSFVIEAGRRGKIEVLDPLNRAAAEIYIDQAEAVLVLRGEKAYWRSGPEDVVEKLLGLRLGLDDVTALLCGRWAGGRTGFRLDVRETFPGGPVPRRADFSGPATEGSLTLLAVTFNAPRAGGLFDQGFLAEYAPKSWSEMERMLRRED